MPEFVEPCIFLDIYSVLYWFDSFVSTHPNSVAVRLLIHRVSLKVYSIEPDTCLKAYGGDIPYRLPYVNTLCCSRLDNEC